MPTKPQLNWGEIERIFDREFPEFIGIGAPYPIFKDTPNRNHIKQFLKQIIAEILDKCLDKAIKPNICGKINEYQRGKNKKRSEIEQFKTNFFK